MLTKSNPSIKTLIEITKTVFIIAGNEWFIIDISKAVVVESVIPTVHKRKPKAYLLNTMVFGLNGIVFAYWNQLHCSS